MYTVADVRDIHPDESVRKCGWSICTPHLSQTHIKHISFPQRWDKASHACCRITLQTVCSLAEPAMTLQILSYGCESVLRPSTSSFCYLSNPACMTSAVKTQRVYASPPPHPVLYGRSLEAFIGEGEIAGGRFGGIPDAWFEGS